jgi:hypothetical protein
MFMLLLPMNIMRTAHEHHALKVVTKSKKKEKAASLPLTGNLDFFKLTPPSLSQAAGFRATLPVPAITVSSSSSL